MYVNLLTQKRTIIVKPQYQYQYQNSDSVTEETKNSK